MRDYSKNLFLSSQGLVQYHQHISIEVKTNNPFYKDGMISKNKFFYDIYVLGISHLI